MTDCLIAGQLPQHKMTVMESPEIGIIGGGEGSTPQLKVFFQKIDRFVAGCALNFGSHRAALANLSA